MSLTSFRFVAFAAVVLLLYNVAPAKHRALFLLVASYVFYADSSIAHLLLLCVITLTTHAAAKALAAKYRPLALLSAIVVVIFPLAVYKYAAFANQLVAHFMGSSPFVTATTALPLGISFFTFQAISYIVDVHRGSTRPETRIQSLALYLAFFPKLVAGPIERANDFMPQLREIVQSRASNVYIGVKLTLWGFFCKLVVADNVGAIVDEVLKSPLQESGGTLAIVFALYAFQIYFDFLGYTSIAIGVARCFNLNLNPNFNRPYAATSLRDFWRRWHISLSSWFRDYVYIPLGGSGTRGAWRAFQILAVFVVSGLWHGAALHFVAWGAFHGAAYWVEDQIRTRIPPWSRPSHRVLYLLEQNAQRALTFGVVTFGWILFRLSDVSDIATVLERIAFLNADIAYGSLNTALIRTDTAWFLLILVSAIALDSSRRCGTALHRVPESNRHVIGELAYVNWMVVGLVLLGDLGVRDFTYAGF